MKNSCECPKCCSRHIVSIPFNMFSGDANKITLAGGFKVVAIIRYVCVECGFTEEWVQKEKDLDYLAKKFKPTRPDDFV